LLAIHFLARNKKKRLVQKIQELTTCINQYDKEIAQDMQNKGLVECKRNKKLGIAQS